MITWDPISGVWTLIPYSCATFASDALSGGINRATALSLNACPYLATLFFHHRPRVQSSMEATTILTRGAYPPPAVSRVDFSMAWQLISNPQRTDHEIQSSISPYNFLKIMIPIKMATKHSI